MIGRTITFLSRPDEELVRAMTKRFLGVFAIEPERGKYCLKWQPPPFLQEVEPSVVMLAENYAHGWIDARNEGTKP